jgi:hypothetical protein
MTITGIAADSTIAGGKGSRAGRRLTALVAMLAGAVIGAALVLYVHIVYPLAIALAVTAVAAASSGWWVGPTPPGPTPSGKEIAPER